ncbi:hypothetical protein JTE90_000152 [Oedothorax gibbosus]|uniref:Neurotransmitter-gated ion-channel ligand-binding domain-containing protein n=1 Tax=Oedothorax gibbosus TaxID=931172 RepID=A0AAV6U5G5_9ARAC|nr:hypothetical protein JTE90_000152 [Oedothorax gibbosus]
MYSSKLLAITCIFVVVFIQNCYADAISESDLRRAIFEHYDKLVRPVKNAATAIPVTASLYPVAIKDVDVKDHIVKLDTWFYVKWHDDYLTWDPSSYGGLEALRVPAEEVWIPDLTVYSGTPDTMTHPTVHTNVVVYANGTVLWVPPFTFKSRCPATENQVTDDHFKCTISVGSWTYDVTLLDLHEKHEDVLEAAKVEAFQDIHHEWTIESMHAKKGRRPSLKYVPVNHLFYQQAMHFYQ